MLTLKSFLKEHMNSNDNELLLENKTTNQLIVQNINSVTIISDEQKLQLSQGIVDYLQSEEFIEELDKKIPLPFTGESKEQYVERALEKAREILDRNFK